MKSHAILTRVFLAIIILCAGVIGCSRNSYAGDSKNVILVLDTSLSMVGFRGKDILNKVKVSIQNYIDNLQDGDRVTFVTFDTEVRIFPTILVDDENDRDIIKKYISMTEAKGKWTFTINMMRAVFTKAEEMQKELDDKDIKTVIVIMTDALDDPPPGKRQQKLNIGEVATQFSGKDDWWIYLVSFMDLKKNEKVVAELKAELEKVSKKTTVIDAEKEPEKGIAVVEQTQPVSSGFPVSILVVILLVLALLILYLLLRKRTVVAATGHLEFWNSEILDPYMQEFDIGRHMTNAIVIGRGVKCTLNIVDIEIPSPFSLQAVKGQEGLTAVLPAGASLEFKNRDQGGSVVRDGDIFQVGNYVFKYFA